MSRFFIAIALLAFFPSASYAESPVPVVEQSIPSAFVVPSNPVIDARVRRFQQSQFRESFQAGRARRVQYEPMLAERIRAAGLPLELAAVVMVESRFENVEARLPARPGGGLWQFIASTGQSYGLRVDGEVDERLDPKLSTDAAMWLLADLHREFGEWGLAFAAYNVGARRVQQAIKEEGTRNCWTLIERGALPHYAADVMAAVQIERDL